MLHRYVWLVLVSSLLGACLCPPAPSALRSFAPPLAGPADAAAMTADTPGLRLRRITGSEHLDQRMAYQRSEVEWGYHASLRWNEKPTRFVERALGAALFESGAYRRSFSSTAPVLSIDLLHFEEIAHGESSVLLSFQVVLEDADGTALLEERFEASALAGSGPADVARALGKLLEREAARLAERLGKVLRG